MKLSIVVPCYNEAKSLNLILEKFKGAIKRPDIEVVLVNNGSSDQTEDILKQAVLLYPFLKVVKVEVNQGYGFGILSGLKQASGQYIGWTHGDMQTPPQDVVRALEIIEQMENPSDIYVKGRRRGRSLFDVFFTLGMSVFESLFLQTRLYDINAQPNIFHRDFFALWKNPPYDFSLDLYALYLARKQKLKIVRFSCVFARRLYGQSHWNVSFLAKWKFIKRTLDFSFKLKKMLKDIL